MDLPDTIHGDTVSGDKVMGDKVMGDKIALDHLPLAPALHQLRAPIGDFVGREQEIEQLVQALTTADSAEAAISGVRGMGGIGKTELAYMVAQRIAAEFPDAQLLLELHGASSNPLSAEQGLQIIIRAFEREAKLPDDLGQLQGLYRSVLSGKRMFILADDARDAAHVRPLLPPPGCALLITSSNRFALPGMVAFDLTMLPPSEAQALLLEICPRIGEHAAELARLCGHLPKALRVSATLLATRTSRPVAAYLKQLGDERTRLAQLRDASDPELDIEASLLLSYAALNPAEQSALCQVSIFPTSFDAAAAGAVVALASGYTVDGVLEELYLLSLLEWDAALERYSLHNLVRAFAAARLADADLVRLRHAQHYARVAWHAEDDLYLKGQALAGLALFDQERSHIDAGWGWAMIHAGEPDADVLLLDYAAATVNVALLRYDARGQRIPQLEAWLHAAQRLGRREDEGAALGNLGIAYYFLGEARRAIDFYELDLIITREVGNRLGEGQTLGNLGSAYRELGELRRAIEFNEQHLGITREIDDRRGEGQALGGLGVAYSFLGELHRALEFYEQWLVIAREIADLRWEGQALGGLGDAYKDLGELRRAIEFYEQWLVIAREIGDRRGEISALGNLGLAYADLGDARQAITFYEQWLVIAREIGDRADEASASWNLGEALAKQGELARAVELMQVYVDYLHELGHPEAEKRAAHLERLRQRLAAAPGATPAEQREEGSQ
jgi:tetratricopeptide (TPR) repeat protein